MVSLLGTVGIMLNGEMAGRIAAVTGQLVFYLIRECAGYAAGLGTSIAANMVSLLTCTAELGGVPLILKLLFGGPYRLLICGALVFFLVVVWFLEFAGSKECSACWDYWWLSSRPSACNSTAKRVFASLLGDNEVNCPPQAGESQAHDQHLTLLTNNRLFVIIREVI